MTICPSRQLPATKRYGHEPPVPGGHELADLVTALVNDTLQGKRGVR